MNPDELEYQMSKEDRKWRIIRLTTWLTLLTVSFTVWYEIIRVFYNVYKAH